MRRSRADAGERFSGRCARERDRRRMLGILQRLSRSVAERKAMIDRGHALPLVTQAQQLGIGRGSIYDLPRPVPRRHRRLVHPACAGVAGVDLARRPALHRGAGGSAGPLWRANDLQQRPRVAVHEHGVHRRPPPREEARFQPVMELRVKSLLLAGIALANRHADAILDGRTDGRRARPQPHPGPRAAPRRP